MRRALLVAAAALAAAGLSAVIAQTVEGLDVAAVKRHAVVQADDAEALAEQVRTRGDAFRADAEALRRASAVTLHGDVATAPARQAGAIDFDALLAGAAQNAATPQGDAPQLIVFASLSMPVASLRPLIADTARAGGVVVFRGFPGNSAKVFTAALTKVVGAGETSVGVDPRLFRAFAIDAVPAFVAVASSFDLCAGFSCQTVVPPHDRMTGNVTLAHALTAFAEGNGPGGRIAAVALARLRGERP